MAESMGPMDRHYAIKEAKRLFRLDECADVALDDVLIALAETVRRAESRFGPVNNRMVHAAKIVLDQALADNQDYGSTCLMMLDVRKALEAAFLVAPDAPRIELLDD